MNRIANENLSRLTRPLKRCLQSVCIATLGLVSPLLLADDRVVVQQQVSAAVNAYLAELKGDRYSRLDADVQPLDTRLLLQPCQVPLAVEHSPRERVGGRITLQVSCPDNNNWSVRIPASVQLYDQVVVAAQSIPMGSQLTGNELEVQEMDVALQYRGYYREPAQLVGFIAKRPIPAGQVLTPVTINPADLVSKGETVAILAEGAGITIRALGVALTNGAMGEVIQVRNTKSNKVVEGRVSAPGQIKVGL